MDAECRGPQHNHDPEGKDWVSKPDRTSMRSFSQARLTADPTKILAHSPLDGIATKLGSTGKSLALQTNQQPDPIDAGHTVACEAS